jgi:CRISPR-associated protein Csm1
MHYLEKHTLDAALVTLLVSSRILKRYRVRTKSGIEAGDAEVENFLSGLEEDRLPESFVVWFARLLSKEISQNELERLRNRSLAVDPLSFAEKTPESSKTPLLSPMWILKLMQQDETSWEMYQELWQHNCYREAENEWNKLLRQILDEENWLPVEPLPRDLSGFLDTLKLHKYNDLASRIRYAEVVKSYIRMLRGVGNFYRRLGSVDGLLETLGAVLTSSLILVPAWVGIRPPDAPLSTVALLNGCLSALENGFSLVALDIHGIQDFIYAPIKEAAASRVLRGRSMLVELIQFTMTRLAIEMLGASIQLIKEGGAPTFITPALDAKRLEEFSELLGKWMTKQYAARLWITVASSQPHQTSGALCPGDPLYYAFEELEQSLVVEKSRRYTYALVHLRELSKKRLKGFDNLTGEPVLEDDMWALEVSQQSMEYASTLAPGKLTVGDLLSGMTHISLACGNVARNLATIVSVYFFKNTKPNEQDAKAFADKLAKSLGEGGQERLYIRGKGIGTGEEIFMLDVALAPFIEVGAIHVLGALSEPKLGRPQRNKAVAIALLNYVIERLKEQKLESDHVHIEVRVVNASQDFVLPEELADRLKELEVKVGVSMLHFFTNTYHPVKHEEHQISLVDLDEMPLIAVAHLDADGVGDIKKKLTRLPILYASLSDFLLMGFGMKAYACLISKADKETGSIILYAGGDDVSAYGRWHDVLELVKDVGTEVLEKFLKPLTASGGISLADNKTPILHLISVAKNAEKEAKRERMIRATAEGLIHIQSLTAEPLRLRGGHLDLEKLTSCLERAKDLREIKAYIYALAELAYEATKLIASQGHAGSIGAQDEIMAKARVVVGYKYLLARREKDFELLNHVFKSCGVLLPSMESNSNEIVNQLVELKPLLDLLALRLREYT